jgi:hypothetical protein
MAIDRKMSSLVSAIGDGSGLHGAQKNCAEDFNVLAITFVHVILPALAQTTLTGR